MHVDSVAYPYHVVAARACDTLSISNPMDKKYLHHLWSTRIKPVHTAYLLVPFLAASTVCVLSLRHNNVMMAERRAAVYHADEKGEHVEETLRELRTYVY